MRAWGKHFEKPTRSEQRRTCDCDRARQNALVRLRAGKLYLVMLWRPCCAGLQLEVAKHIVTAATKVVCQHGATFVLCGIAARGYKTHCVVCAKRRIWVTEATEEVAQKRSSWEKRSLIFRGGSSGMPKKNSSWTLRWVQVHFHGVLKPPSARYVQPACICFCPAWIQGPYMHLTTSVAHGFRNTQTFPIGNVSLTVTALFRSFRLRRISTPRYFDYSSPFSGNFRILK